MCAHLKMVSEECSCTHTKSMWRQYFFLCEHVLEVSEEQMNVNFKVKRTLCHKFIYVGNVLKSKTDVDLTCNLTCKQGDNVIGVSTLQPFLPPHLIPHYSPRSSTFDIQYSTFDAYLMRLQPIAGSHQSLRPHTTGSILAIQPVSDVTGAGGQDPINDWLHATLQEDEIGSCWVCLTPISFSSHCAPGLTIDIQLVSDMTGAKLPPMVNLSPHLRRTRVVVVELAWPLSQLPVKVYWDRCHTPNMFGTVNMEHTVDSRLSWSKQ